ncbi:CvpA family protein [Balneolales bacterium ANBcel1]|nr:CvpA family protein [Balneolales bacterium ANBcel1]
MNLLDGLALLFILYFAWRGYRNGLIKEVFRIVGLVLAGFVAFQYADLAGSLIRPVLDIDPQFIPYISFTALFVLAMVAVQLGIAFLDALIQLLLLSIPNRLLGSLFGVLKSSLLVSIALIVLSGFGIPGSETRNQSVLYKSLVKVAPASYDIVARVLPGVKPYKESVEEYLSIPD